MNLMTARISAIWLFATAPIACGAPYTDDEDVPSSSETLEEIVVYGEKSLSRLRYEINTAEVGFFTVFNGLNSTDEFDVECEYVVDLGSYRRRHLCMPKFAEREEYLATQNMLMSGRWDDYRVRESRVSKKEERMWNEIADLVSKNPELQSAMTKLADANRAYEVERRRREAVNADQE